MNNYRYVVITALPHWGRWGQRDRVLLPSLILHDCLSQHLCQMKTINPNLYWLLKGKCWSFMARGFTVFFSWMPFFQKRGKDPSERSPKWPYRAAGDCHSARLGRGAGKRRVRGNTAHDEGLSAVFIGGRAQQCVGGSLLFLAECLIPLQPPPCIMPNNPEKEQKIMKRM